MSHIYGLLNRNDKDITHTEETGKNTLAGWALIGFQKRFGNIS
jgi:hypothetical protein